MTICILVIIITILIGILIGVITKNKTVKYLSWGILGCGIALFLLLYSSNTPQQARTGEDVLTNLQDEEEKSDTRDWSNEELTEAGLEEIQNKNFERGIAYLTRAAEQGHAPAQIYLGNLNYLGWGIPEDIEKAFFWYLKAAETGDAEGQFNVAEMYYYNEVYETTPKDIDATFQQAKRWAKSAAAQGHEEAKILLGKVEKIMEKTLDDRDTAADYYFDCGWHHLKDGRYPFLIEENLFSSVAYGSSDAALQLGILYFEGNILEQNDEEAEKMLREALALGKEEAKEYLREIEKRKKSYK